MHPLMSVPSAISFFKKWEVKYIPNNTPSIRRVVTDSVDIPNSIKLQTPEGSYDCLSWTILQPEEEQPLLFITTQGSRTHILKRSHDGLTTVCSLSFGSSICVWSPENSEINKNANDLLPSFSKGGRGPSARYNPILPHPKFPHLTDGPLLQANVF